MRYPIGCHPGLVLFFAVLASSAEPALGQEAICRQVCQGQYDTKIKDCAGNALGNTAAACKDPLTRALQACLNSCIGAPPIQGLPAFGTCLIELRAGGYSEGFLVNAGTPYFVWTAVKTTGQSPTTAPWRRFGPFTLAGGQRYIFRDSNVTPNTSATSTTISPGLASLHYENSLLHPVWYVFNPLPPGCGGPGGTGTSGGAGSATTVGIFSGHWTGTWRNSLGDSGPSTLILSDDGNRITGSWDGMPVMNAKRSGSTVRWTSSTASNGNLGHTTYNAEITLVGEGKLTCTYQGAASSKTYSGSIDYTRR